MRHLGAAVIEKRERCLLVTTPEAASARSDTSQRSMTEADIHAKVDKAYSGYLANGGDGKDNLCRRAAGWGYTKELLSSLGLAGSDGLFEAACGGGCPLRLKGQRPPARGECVMDLGCGGGHDVVLASRMVGASGSVIGVDLTEPMLKRARQNVATWNARAVDAGRVHLLRGAIDGADQLAGVVAEGAADLVISNGVFNLTNDKPAAFRAAFRVCRPGGRFHLSGIVAGLCAVGRPRQLGRLGGLEAGSTAGSN